MSHNNSRHQRGTFNGKLHLTDRKINENEQMKGFPLVCPARFIDYL